MKKLGIGAMIVGMMVSMIDIGMKIKQRAAISIIGGADGPTSIFIAGQLGSGLGILGMILGIVLLIIGVLLILKKR